jgi:hypothetical protein
MYGSVDWWWRSSPYETKVNADTGGTPMTHWLVRLTRFSCAWGFLKFGLFGRRLLKCEAIWRGGSSQQAMVIGPMQQSRRYSTTRSGGR